MSDGLKLLGAVVDNGSVNILRELKAEYFIDEEVAVFQYMQRHYRRYGSIPTIETLEAEKGITIPEAEENISYYLQRVEDRYCYEFIKTDFQRLKGALRDYNMEAAREIVESLRRTNKLTTTSNDIRNIAEAASQVVEQYEHAHANPGLSGVSTGLPRLDHLTGGWQAGDLITLVSRPAQGKTWILLANALAAWNSGSSVLIVTMEMTVPQITRRLLAMHSGINPKFIIRGQLSNHARDRFMDCVDNLVGTDRMHLYSGGKRKRPSDVGMLIQEYRPDIVLVDGVHLMNTDDTRATQQNQRVSSLFDGMNQLTIDHSIPVLGTTHLNRAAGTKGKAASLETVAYSDAIGTHSSIVISVNEGIATKEKTQRQLTIIKGREGEEGTVHTNFTFSPMNFGQAEYTAAHHASAHTAIEAVAENLDWMG